MDIADIEQTYDLLTNKVKADLDAQFNKNRIKGTEYADAYTKLMGVIIGVCVQAPKLDQDKEVSKAQALKLTKEADVPASTIKVNENHADMLKRQTEGFDDNVNQELFKAQINAWSMMFSSGMLETQPDIIKNDEVTSLYQHLKKD